MWSLAAHPRHPEGLARAAHPSRRLSRARASASSSSRPLEPRIPRSSEEQVEQAVASILRAFRDGCAVQRVEILLPLIGATELDDWPGGVQQQLKAATPIVEALLRELKREPGLEGRITPRFLDKASGGDDGE